MYRSGIGYDTHRLVKGRALILGGVRIPYLWGLDGHSDADVLTHALMDALLGAAGLPDIGNFFPDDQLEFKDADSLKLLEYVIFKIGDRYEVVNADAVILCQRPKLKSFIAEMKENLSKIMSAPVNVKATTTEKMNAEGKGKCISVQAVALLKAKEGDNQEKL